MVQGVQQFRAKMRAIPVVVREEVARDMEVTANLIVRTMKSFAPRKTGALANSIGWTWGQAPEGSLTVGAVEEEGLRITIFAGGAGKGTKRVVRKGSGIISDVARFQEFGTTRAPARPFFFPVWRANRRLVRGRISRAIRRAITRLNRS